MNIQKQLIAVAANDSMLQNIKDARYVMAWKRAGNYAVAFVADRGVEVAFVDALPKDRTEAIDCCTQCVIGLGEKMKLQPESMLKTAKRAVREKQYRIYWAWKVDDGEVEKAMGGNETVEVSEDIAEIREVNAGEVEDIVGGGFEIFYPKL